MARWRKNRKSRLPAELGAVTKKDFRHIAAALCRHQAPAALAEDLKKYFASSNPRFNAARFDTALRACAIPKESTMLGRGHPEQKMPHRALVERLVRDNLARAQLALRNADCSSYGLKQLVQGAQAIQSAASLLIGLQSDEARKPKRLGRYWQIVSARRKALDSAMRGFADKCLR